MSFLGIESLEVNFLVRFHEGERHWLLVESFSSPPILSRLYEIDERCNVKERDMECVSYE